MRAHDDFHEGSNGPITFSVIVCVGGSVLKYISVNLSSSVCQYKFSLQDQIGKKKQKAEMIVVLSVATDK